ncbi:adenylate kinase-domain-containing protein, partial [Scenedesmus sp. NREL 46B-D3]
MATPKLLVFVLGAPGAGKGTQSQLIVKEFGWTHVSAGDLVRAEVQKGTELGKQAEEIMREGNMVPGSMVIGLLKEALSSGEHTKVLVDGFPRVLEQLHEFEQQVRPCNTALYYKLAEDVAVQRLLQRSESSGRADDNEETIHKRFVVFEEQSMPVVDALREQCRLSEINAAAAPEEVYAATKQVIQQLEQELATAEAAAASTAAAEAETAAPTAPAEAA